MSPRCSASQQPLVSLAITINGSLPPLVVIDVITVTLFFSSSSPSGIQVVQPSGRMCHAASSALTNLSFGTLPHNCRMVLLLLCFPYTSRCVLRSAFAIHSIIGDYSFAEK